ncbi:5-phosphate dependent protein [Lichtheimia corymbifera JMRC:FSU:9682]|uniref:5-phosphate dependent protein n=1 Tax=Lichtheimia corymbifera JMRC:FSU:9682 TaxID=1263082 RepID=A0A068S0Q6_9FUNG|nr:5-phosphate dependent protein [Lichtheimia corymbifera JMRC:FSU:9682]
MASLVIEQLNPPSADPQYKSRQVDPDSNAFVLSYPRGAYTGMRTVNRTAIVELDSHIKRITNSLSLLKFVPDGQQGEPEDVTRDMEPYRQVDSLQERLLPLLKAGLTAFKPDGANEIKVVVMVAYSYEKRRPCFAAHFSTLTRPPNHRIKVVVQSKTRDNPVVKDSKWVQERATMNDTKGEDVNEVVLSDDSGNLYEGMSSNFFIVKTRNDGQPVVVCAPLEHILLGTVMKIVMKVCEKHQIPIEWTFPQASDARNNKWEGCFITSTSRLLLPIETVYFKDGSPTIHFTERSPTIDLLQSEVQQEIYQRAHKIL